MAGVGKGGEKGLRSGPPGSYATQQGSPWQLFSVCSMEPGDPEGQDGGSVVHSGMPGEPCGIVGPKTPITQEFCRVTKLKSKFSCTHAQCDGTTLQRDRHCSVDGTASLQRYYTIVHNGRFHEVGCDIQDFKRQPEAVRRTHTHHITSHITSDWGARVRTRGASSLRARERQHCRLAS
jgi:hypothetical protein